MWQPFKSIPDIFWVVVDNLVHNPNSFNSKNQSFEGKNLRKARVECPRK
jgi:hypothetical protein